MGLDLAPHFLCCTTAWKIGKESHAHLTTICKKAVSYLSPIFRGFVNKKDPLKKKEGPICEFIV